MEEYYVLAWVYFAKLVYTIAPGLKNTRDPFPGIPGLFEDILEWLEKGPGPCPGKVKPIGSLVQNHGKVLLNLKYHAISHKK